MNAYYQFFKTKYSTKVLKYINQIKVDTDNKAQQQEVDEYFANTDWIDNATEYIISKQEVAAVHVNDIIDVTLSRGPELYSKFKNRYLRTNHK